MHVLPQETRIAKHTTSFLSKRACPMLIYPSNVNARMHTFYSDKNIFCIENSLENCDYLFVKKFLNLRAPAKVVYDAVQFAKSQYPSIALISNVHMPREGQKVMHAQRGKRNVFLKDYRAIL